MVEVFNLAMSEATAETLESVRLEAEALDPLRRTPHPIQFGGEDMQMQARRPRSALWVVFNDDFQITLGTPNKEWSVTVRYGSAGLWEHGHDALRDRVLAMLLREMRPNGDDWQRVSEAHWAFDFEAPGFTDDMKPGITGNVVCHSSTKKREIANYSAGVKVQTIEIGSRKGNVQVQVYDKGREIKEASGKEWMVKLWSRDGWSPARSESGRILNVWRLEIRMKKEFLKQRRCNRLEALKDNLDSLLAEVLFTRRLTRPNGDKNRARWPLHPLWSEAYRATAGMAEMAPLGREITLRGDELIRMFAMQTQGLAINVSAIRAGGFDELEITRLLDDIRHDLLTRPDAEYKADLAAERYRYVYEAR